MMANAGQTTPEYLAIRNCRDALEEHMKFYLKDVASKLRAKGYLADHQYKSITDAGDCSTLVDAMLLSIKLSPVSSFFTFVDALKVCGAIPFKGFIKNEIEKKRKELYREKFRCDSSKTICCKSPCCYGPMYVGVDLDSILASVAFTCCIVLYIVNWA